jgi:uncharacterized membrane protein HdeD (DUF308 family)
MTAVDLLARNWWIVLIRGLAGIAFGVLTFIAPGISLAALVLVFGAYALTDGVLAIVSAVRRGRRAERWWLLLIEGLIGIAAGITTLLWPGITALALLYLVAFWAIMGGILEIVAAVQLRRVLEHEWLLALSGIASVVLGVLLLLFPVAGALTLVVWIGAYALVFGALLVALSLRLRAWSRGHTSHTRAFSPA